MTDRRQASKLRRAQRKRARKKRIRRDQEVTREHGDAAHRSCGRKARYPTEADALALARKFEAMGAPTLRTYKCRYCGGWHLTKTSQRKGRGGEAHMGRDQGRGDGAVPEATARAAAIDARLGMEVVDIAATLRIGVGEVEDAIASYAYASDEELGITQGAGRDAQEGQAAAARGSASLHGRYWLVMAVDGTPVTLCGTRSVAAAVSKAMNRALKAAGAGGAVTHVEGVDAWEGADDGDRGA